MRYIDMCYIFVMSPQVFHILLALTACDQHGYAIMQDVSTRTGGKLRPEPGTLYGSVKRMLEQGINRRVAAERTAKG